MAGLSLPGVQPRNREMANNFMGNAVNTFGSQRPNQNTETTPPDPTLGGAIGAGAGGAAAGASIGSAVAGGASTGSAAGGYGAAIGAIVGMAAYLLS